MLDVVLLPALYVSKALVVVVDLMIHNVQVSEALRKRWCSGLHPPPFEAHEHTAAIA